MKRAILGSPFSNSTSASFVPEPAHQSGIEAEVVLVRHPREAQDHPVKLDGADREALFPHVKSATEHYRHPAVADDAIPACARPNKACAKGAMLPLWVVTHRTKRISVRVRPRFIDAAEVRGSAQPTGDVEVRGSISAARMPATIGAGELITAIDFRQRCFLCHAQDRNHAKQNGNADKLSHYSSLHEIAPLPSLTGVSESRGS
jgi:hypothetical protein